MSFIIDYLREEPSAINKSWICFENSTKCEFLSAQQFHRSSPNAGLIEGSFLIAISALAIPSNIWAIYNYSKKTMNKELLVLIYALCFYNFLTVPVNIINGLARMADNFPLGEFGCFLAIPFGCAVNNSTSLTLALISYERKNIILSRSTASANGGRLNKIITALVLINIFSFINYSVIFYYFLDMVAIIQYPIYGSHEAPVDICMPQVDKYGIPLDALFSLYHFFIPLSFTTYNYIKLWLQSQQLRRNSLSYRKHHQINIFFSRLMIACLVEFVICQLPFDIVLGIAWFQEYTKQMTLQSTSIFLGFILVYSDSVVNPLWFSFVALKRPCSKNGVARRTNLNLVQTSANPSALDESNFSFTN